MIDDTRDPIPSDLGIPAWDMHDYGKRVPYAGQPRTMPQVITVRTWFRMLRAVEWRREMTSGIDNSIDIYFRNETMVSPLTPVTHVYGLVTLQALIDKGAPMYAIDRVRLSMRDTILA